MRTRQRTILNHSVTQSPFHYGWTVRNCSGIVLNSGGYDHPGYTVSTDYVDERIQDDVGLGVPHGVVHRFKHTEISEAMRPLTAPNNEPQPAGTTAYSDADPVWIPSCAYWLTDWNAWNVNSDANPYRVSIDRASIDENFLISGCLQKANQLQADVLLDIVEANQMWPSIKSIATTLPLLKQNWRDIRKVMKTASGGYLAWKFGVSPVFSDINAIHRGLGKLKGQLKRHADGEVNRFQTVGHPTMVIDDSDRINARHTGQPIDITYCAYTPSLVPTVRVVLLAKPRVKFQTELFQKLDFALTRFATSPASLAWEKVPFSFVADWFVDISGALRVLDRSLGFCPYDIKSFTKSFSYDITCVVEHEYVSSCSGTPSLGKYLVGSCQYKHYERSVLSSAIPLISMRNRFGKNQAAISAALIAQQLTKLTRVRLELGSLRK